MRDGPDGSVSLRALVGNTPIGEAHDRPPELHNSHPQDPTIWEPESDDPKAHVRATQARSSVVDETARTWSDPGPSRASSSSNWMSI